jgi:hypothetical protein
MTLALDAGPEGVGRCMTAVPTTWGGRGLAPHVIETFEPGAGSNQGTRARTHR